MPAPVAPAARRAARRGSSGCTSGTIAMGETATLKLIGEARACRHATTPVTASLAALHHLGAWRVSILTPYHEDGNGASATTTPAVASK